MDPATAKILVSAALVFSIALFSLVSLEAMVRQVGRDLRAARVPARGGAGRPPHAP